MITPKIWAYILTIERERYLLVSNKNTNNNKIQGEKKSGFQPNSGDGYIPRQHQLLQNKGKSPKPIPKQEASTSVLVNKRRNSRMPFQPRNPRGSPLHTIPLRLLRPIRALLQQNPHSGHMPSIRR